MQTSALEHSPMRLWHTPYFGILALLCAALAAYLPTFFIPFVHIDEGAWAEMGRYIFSGQFYELISDNKPPILLEFHWLLSLGEHSMRALHFFLAIWTFFGALAFEKILRTYFSPALSISGALLFCLLSGTLNYGAFSAERVFLPFLIFATLLALKGSQLSFSPKKLALALSSGIFIGAAINTKQTASFFALLPLIIFFRTEKRHFVTYFFAVMSGAFLISFISWKVTGTPFDSIWKEAFAQNLNYVGFQNYRSIETLKEIFLDAGLVFGIAYAATSLGILLFVFLFLSRRLKASLFSWDNLEFILLGFASLASVALGQRFFQQYYTATLPFLIVLTLLSLNRLPEHLQKRVSTYLVLTAIISLLIFHIQIVYLQTHDRNKNYDSQILKLVTEIKKDSQPKDSLWISNALGSVYFLTDRKPAIKYLFFLHLIHFAEICRADESALKEDLSDSNYRAALTNLKQNRPRIIFWVTRNVNSCSDRLKLENFPSIENIVKSKYELKWSSKLGKYYVRKGSG